MKMGVGSSCVKKEKTENTKLCNTTSSMLGVKRVSRELRW